MANVVVRRKAVGLVVKYPGAYGKAIIDSGDETLAAGGILVASVSRHVHSNLVALEKGRELVEPRFRRPP